MMLFVIWAELRIMATTIGWQLYILTISFYFVSQKQEDKPWSSDVINVIVTINDKLFFYESLTHFHAVHNVLKLYVWLITLSHNICQLQLNEMSTLDTLYSSNTIINTPVWLIFMYLN